MYNSRRVNQELLVHETSTPRGVLDSEKFVHMLLYEPDSYFRDSGVDN